MTATELSSLYNTSTRTIKRWRKLNAPLDDPDAMRAWIENHRSRIGVGKYSPRHSEPTPVTPVPEVVAEIMPVEPEKVATVVNSGDSNAPEDDEGTLQRLEQAERTAYQRYIDTGGSERAAQIWLLVCDQNRGTSLERLLPEHERGRSTVSTESSDNDCPPPLTPNLDRPNGNGEG
jgi:hypothetical protein